MRNSIVVLILLSSIPAFGQNHFIGVKGGIGLTNIINDDFFSGTGFRSGFTGGLTYDYKFENNFTVGSDLVYAQRGFTEDLFFTDEMGNPVGGNLIADYNYDYISLPIKAGYSIGNDFGVFFNIGVVPSVLINGEIKYPAIGNLLPAQTYKVTENATKFDLGAHLEIGASYKLEERFFLFATVAYQHNFLPFMTEGFYKGWKATHYGMTAMFGVKYAL